MGLFFLGALLGMALMGFFGLIGIIGASRVFIHLLEHYQEILAGLGFFVIGILFVTIGWGIFCKCADKLKDS